ncbi:MAG: glycosyltransferase family 4 protein [Candidatus Puniceispirillaceae bacterium]|jgi:glycosyltransferase involved in cell wall biosynthesis|nr:glycosyltransferase family 4 protein [Alphaproteobacteria bacterium]|tara:strand:- start:409 stop:1566 length:1158 start_codon:yes stop_codon:yes gene_type:complete
MATRSSITKPVIVQILPALNRGGVERGTVEVADAIVKNGWKSVVISNGGLLTSQLKRVGATVYEVPVHRKNPFLWGSARRQVKRILQQEGADIVHVRSRAPAWIALPAANSLGIATVSTVHSKFAPANIFKKIYNGKMLKADRVIAISHFVENEIFTHYGKSGVAEKLSVIHRGVDLGMFDPKAVNQQRIIAEADRLGLPDDKSIIMLPARATSWKGHEILIQALAQLSDKDAILMLLGIEDGPPAYAEKLRTMAVRYGLGGRVRIGAGSRDMPAALMLADVVAMPSIKPEPFGRVAIEALAMGRPVVAFRHGGAVESIDEGRTGWLADPLSVDSLAEALQTALSLTPRKRRALAKDARQQMTDQFSKDMMCERTLAVYKSLLKK